MSTRSAAVDTMLGFAVATVGWLTIVPWELAERRTGGSSMAGGDDYWPRFVSVLAVVPLIVALIAWWRREGYVPASLSAGATLILWFGYRTSAAHTDGANLWPLATIMFASAAFALFGFLGVVLGSVRRR
jgi:hypothetical protein